MNIYNVYNQELERMHALLKWYLALPEAYSDPYRIHYGSSTGGPAGATTSTNSSRNPYHASKIFDRIQLLQEALIQAIKNNDQLVQEKVAELALTDAK